ncbi:adenylate/guanylate cyclase domain-containing protein [Candidatus Viadribacter manganicus]|uniref:Guanylate cyclase domain-containing protein n=1 Tax=Candidatus Viadribacter manganicus TaxID=1759059 RepID=A0A1B1ALN1_9PROT|nr:adenylate/guanylate cyclase domain-containing protein [Candidatus Viadribacter manganicus]ANP47488.1 hypothetical protein ATE48_17015 [Candidatus Viadribacter manganicus]
MSSSGSPVGYLFADIEGSTERWERNPAHMQIAIARLDSLIEEAVTRHDGLIRDRAGDGLFATFSSGNPLQCALDLQLEVQRTDWSEVGGLALRMGVHSGEDDGSGQVDRVVANRAARIMSSGWGGQIVVSRTAAERYRAPDGAALVDHGACRFKGIAEPLHLAALVHPDLQRNEFPPLRTLLADGPGGQGVSGPIFGRTRELTDVSGKLDASRTATLVGPGGNGKTRVAQQIAAERSQHQLVCFASFETVAEGAEPLNILALALRLQLHVGGKPKEQIVEYLRDKYMLLVLDNAETMAGKAEFVAELLRECPRLSVLVTSREPLGFPGELPLFLNGFAPPDDASLQNGSSPALQLFVHEARQRDAAFNVDAAQFPAFKEICRIVDGSPLALRLTAQWSLLLSLEEILERIESSVGFLSPENARDQRQTLRGVFDGSWRLLNPDQQRALARLSIFSNSFNTVAAADAAGVDVRVLFELERKGLIVKSSLGRFAMHVMVREYARGKLDPAAESIVRRQHAHYFLHEVRTNMLGRSSEARVAMLEQLRLDFLEVRAAWLHAVKSAEHALISDCIEACCYFLYTRSLFREAVELFSADVADAGLKTHFAAVRANFLVHQGDTEGVAAAASWVLSSQGGAELPRAHAHHAMANLAHMRGEFEQANTHYEEAFAIRDRVGDLRGCCYASVSLSALHLLFTKIDTARSHVKRGYRLARQVGDPFGMMAAHLYAGDLAAFEQRTRDAQENYEMSLRLEESLLHLQFRAVLHRRLGTLFALREDMKSALSHHQEAYDLSREVGDRRTNAHAAIEVGNDLRLLGEWVAAKQVLLRGIRQSTLLGMQPCLSRGLLELAQVELALGSFSIARRLLSVLEAADLGDMAATRDALIAQLDGGAPATFAPVTVQDLLKELLAEAEVDSLRL